MESTLTKLTKPVEREKEMPSQSEYSGNARDYGNSGREEPTYSLEQTQLILQRAQRHKIAKETARTERIQQSALENYLRENRVEEENAPNGISLNTIYEVARQNMGLGNEDVDWALRNCAISSAKIKELLKENDLKNSEKTEKRRNRAKNKYFMNEFRERILGETTSMLEEKIGGSFSQKVKNKIKLSNLLFGSPLVFKRATFYANEETDGRKKKRKLAEIDFEVVGRSSSLGPDLYVKVCDPLFLEILKDWKKFYERISSEENERGNLNYMGISLHIENEIDLP